MNQNETLKNLKKLLEAFPDVKIVDEISGDGKIFLDFRTSSKNTLARIAYACEASNVVMEVGAPPVFQYGYGKPIYAQNLYYRICIPVGDDESDPPTTMQVLGIYLARDLKALELISVEVSNALQKEWNAMIM
ncbi:MAG: hypothetical protein P8X55_04395 [Desulfosarcinaceae bacterium]